MRAIFQANNLILFLLLLAVTAGEPAASQTQSSSELERVALLLDGEQPEKAIEILDALLGKKGKNAEALVLRSTARFMLGELESGRKDLERALDLDPRHRQGWLNLAALELAQGKYGEALTAFSTAESLDPEAADNSLNIGAALVLLGRYDEADGRFRSYLARNPRDPEARYLVASNYAMAGQSNAAVAYLRQAISLDERMRRRARTDANFSSLEASSSFRAVMNTDTYRHPAGSLRAVESFNAPFLGGQSLVLGAVISSLQLANRPFDPQVEVADSWALVWSDIRIKIADNGSGGTNLELSAPPRKYQPQEWQALTTEMFRSVTVQLHTRTRGSKTRGR